MSQPWPNRRQTLRWLLRTLCDPPFLRLYLEARRVCLRVLESAFWALPADNAHPEAGRRAAWQYLRKHVEKLASLDIVSVFNCIYNLVFQLSRGENIEVPSYYGLNFLFPGENTPRLDQQELANYIETHAHFRGSIPQDVLWARLMKDARLRATHRSNTVQVGDWVKTRAELLALACELCEKHRADQPLLIRAIKVIAIRANFGRYLTAQRNTLGLSEFTRAYDRFSRVAKSRGKRRTKKLQDDAYFTLEVLNRFHSCGIRALELRPTAETSRIELQAKLRPLVLGYLCHLQQHEDPVCLGFVVSLFKQEVASHRAKRSYHIEGSTAEPWMHAQSTVWQRQVRGLLEVLEHVPALRLLVVGLDAAGREQGSPIRQLAPAFDILRRYQQKHGTAHHTPGRRLRTRWMKRLGAFSCKQQNASFISKLEYADSLWNKLNNDELPLPPIRPIRLGVTIHAGEDFIDPITGLREIWEAIEFLKLKNGDRIGHALAAALSPKLLMELFQRRARSSFSKVEALPGKSNYRLIKPVGVHLLDTAWELELLQSPTSEQGALFRATNQAFTATPGTELRERLSAVVPPSALVPGLHFYEMENVPPELLTQVSIDTAYRTKFEKLRKRVLARIRQRKLFVESCPTSNIVVAGLKTAPLEVFVEDLPNRVTVASDDPAIFQAWPNEELARYSKHFKQLVENSGSATFL